MLFRVGGGMYACMGSLNLFNLNKMFVEIYTVMGLETSRGVVIPNSVSLKQFL